jgi:hypothetical protein
LGSLKSVKYGTLNAGLAKIKELAMYQIFSEQEPLFVGKISNYQHTADSSFPFQTLRIRKKRHFVKYRGTEITKEGFRDAAQPLN